MFSEVTLPLDDETVLTASEVTVGDEPAQSIGFTELFRTGDVDPINGETYGLIKDYKGDPAVSGTGVPYISPMVSQAVAPTSVRCSKSMARPI